MAIATQTHSEPCSIEFAWAVIRHWLGTLVHNADFWNAFWPAICGAAAGAILAFTLERRRRKEERIRQEFGQCHTIAYTLLQMLSILEDLEAQLFTNFEKKHGKQPDWDQIGGLDGAPERGPGFIIKDYAFLLDGTDQSSKAPQLLYKTWIAAGNFDAILERLNLRTRLWNQYDEQRLGAAFALGIDAVSKGAPVAALSKRLEDLTSGLKEDLPEAIAGLRTLLDLLYGVISVRYPKRRFIRATPNDVGARPLAGGTSEKADR